MLAGCASRNIDTVDAVKQGVIRDIPKSINIGAMDVNVVSVSFRDKEADAVVSFTPKGGPAAPGLTMSYTMERRTDGWHIKSRAGLQQHAAQAPAVGMQEGEMPANPHGAGDSSALPPGHPPLGDTKKQ